MALWLIGLGPSPELNDLTRRAELALRRADRVLVDTFTATAVEVRCAALGRLLQRPVEPLAAPDAATRDEVIADARARDVAIAVAGDPLVATPHRLLRQQALACGVSVEVVPGVSALTAAPSLAGLDAATLSFVVVEDPAAPGRAVLEQIAAALDAGLGCVLLGAGRADDTLAAWPHLMQTLSSALAVDATSIAIDGADAALLVTRRSNGRGR